VDKTDAPVGLTTIRCLDPTTAQLLLQLAESDQQFFIRYEGV
jgi:hypothetical protein